MGNYEPFLFISIQITLYKRGRGDGGLEFPDVIFQYKRLYLGDLSIILPKMQNTASVCVTTYNVVCIYG